MVDGNPGVRPNKRMPSWRTSFTCYALSLLGGCALSGAWAQEPSQSDSAAAATPPATSVDITASPDLQCPITSNCVNSVSDSALSPLTYQGTATQGMAHLLRTLSGMPEVSITERNARFVTTIFTTTLGFRDEVVFVVAAEGGTIDYRSRSLLGLYDFGKNRSRMLDFIRRFQEHSARP